MKGKMAAAPMAEASTRPDSRSVSSGPVPRYGTCSMNTSDDILRYSKASWPALPLPAEP
ncbi:hypothetical protein D3C78_1629680 [compost metagenome]